MPAADTEVARIDRFEGEYNFLSNMHEVTPSGILIIDEREKIKVPTSEHIYASSKFANIEDRTYVREAPTGKKARDRARDLAAQGHELACTSPEGKLLLMEEALMAKFAIGTRMATLLLQTKDAQLIEGNDWGDNFWGCSPPDNPDGLNHLGRLLMKRRFELQKGTLS